MLNHLVAIYELATPPYSPPPNNKKKKSLDREMEGEEAIYAKN
jgi:hypothetical protein